MRRLLSGVLAVALLLDPALVHAQAITGSLVLPPVRELLQPTSSFDPVMMDGLVLHSEDPFRFDFLVDKGDASDSAERLTEQMGRQVRYFLSALAIPEKNIWVNLSPGEKDRILPEDLSRTTMGRDLLAQDYLLKQMAASLTFPDEALGREYWDRVMKRTYEKFGTSDVPRNAMGKVWVVPEKAVIYEKGNTAFLVESRLKLMSENDFWAMEQDRGAVPGGAGDRMRDDISATVIREVILPELEKEVNEGRTFAQLRQIFQAVILASWYKDKLRNGLLAKIYVGQARTNGIEPADKNFREQIFNRYLDMFRSGVYNLIRETYDPARDEVIPRKYISGGLNMALEGVRTMTADPAVALASKRIQRDHAIAAFAARPQGADFAMEEKDIRQDEGALRVYGDPKNFELWAQAVFPRPPDVINKRGDMVAFWAMTAALLEILLDKRTDAGHPFRLGETELETIIHQLSADYLLKNIVDPDLGFGVQDLFDYLVDLGFVQLVPGQPGEARKYYIEESMRPQIATWARLSSVIEKEFEVVFGENNVLDENKLLDLIRRYEGPAAADQLNLVEPFQPFLRAVLDLAPERQEQILGALHRRFFEGEWAPFTGGMMVDAILIVSDRISPKELQVWGKTVFPNLTQKGRAVYLAAAEITLLKGGLGRVMQYLGRALNKMGVSVVFLEARYDAEVAYDANGNIKTRQQRRYEDLSVPLKMPLVGDPGRMVYTVEFDGREVECWAYEAVNDEDIPVLTFRDKEGYYIQDVYYEGPGSAPVAEQALFQGKALWGAMQAREMKRQREQEQRGETWVPPVVGLNDGQTLAAGIYRLYDPNYQTEVSLLAHEMGTGHTVKNTIALSQDALKKAGVPVEFWWLFKNKGIYGGEMYDASKGGLLATILTGGAANNVSTNHREVMQPYLTTVGGVIHGVTNGDLVSLTLREWNKTFVRLFAGPEYQQELTRMEQALAQADTFQKAVIRRNTDDFLLQVFRRYWFGQGADLPTRSRWAKAVIKSAKTRLFTALLSDARFRADMGVIIPEESGDQVSAAIDRLAEELSGALLKYYTGRGVVEKLGLEGAHTRENLEHRAQLGIVTVLQANKQYYPGTNSPGQSVFVVNELKRLAREINEKGYPGKVFVVDSFGLEQQLLLLAAGDIVQLDSQTLRLNGGLLPTGASESTEAHGRISVATPNDHGFIDRINSFGPAGKGEGATFVPGDSRPETYRRLDDLQQEMFQQGTLEGMTVRALNEFFAVDTKLTAGFGYAPLWDRAIAAEEDRRAALAESQGRPLVDLLKEEHLALARPEKEVSLSGEISAVRLQAHDGLEWRVDLPVSMEGQNKILHLLPSREDAPIEALMWVNPQGIPPNVISAALTRKGNVERTYPMKLVEIDERGWLGFAARIEAQEWKRWRSGQVVTMSASGGMWHESSNVLISTHLPRQQRDIIRRDIEERGGMTVLLAGQPKTARETMIVRGAGLTVTVSFPLERNSWVGHLRVVPYVKSPDGNWHFLGGRDFRVADVVYHMSNQKEGLSSRLSLEVTIPNLQLDRNVVTFALFGMGDDPYAPGGENQAIVWANKPGDDFIVHVRHMRDTQASDDAAMTQERGSQTEEITPGGIKLDTSLMHKEIVRDSPGEEVPVLSGGLDQGPQISGLVPELLGIQPIHSVRALLGLSP